MDPYSPLLAAALLASALGLGAAFWSLAGPSRQRPRAARLTRAAALGGLALVALALAFHLLLGHRPGTAQALAFTAFWHEHPAPLVAAVLAATALLLRPRG